MTSRCRFRTEGFLALAESGRFDEAQKTLEKAIKLAPADYNLPANNLKRLLQLRKSAKPQHRTASNALAFIPGTADAPGESMNALMKFLFDFGDSWRFELRLERIEPPGNRNAPIKLLESTGEPPKQYPDWE